MFNDLLMGRIRDGPDSVSKAKQIARYRSMNDLKSDSGKVGRIISRCE
jgi:hypothetical protein